MTEEYPVAKTNEIPAGQGCLFEVNERMIAIFNDNGEFKAIDDTCPHAGASLSEGWLDSGCVTCPWHAWQFKLDDGTYTQNPKLAIEVFPVRVEGDQIFVTIP